MVFLKGFWSINIQLLFKEKGIAKALWISSISNNANNHTFNHYISIFQIFFLIYFSYIFIWYIHLTFSNSFRLFSNLKYYLCIWTYTSMHNSLKVFTPFCNAKCLRNHSLPLFPSCFFSLIKTFCIFYYNKSGC